MEKKMLIIVCFVMMIGSYFLYNYQGKQREKAYKEKVELEEKVHQDSIAIIDAYEPLSSIVEKEIRDYIAETVKKESTDKHARRLYYLVIDKEPYAKYGHYLQMSSGYGFDKSQIKGFTRLNGDIVIYYGNIPNIKQTLIDESKLLTSFDELEFYVDQKPEKETKPATRRYHILDDSTLVLMK